MAESYRMFSGGSYSAVQVAAYLESICRDGIVAGQSNELACTASGADLNVAVAAGYAFLGGYWYYNSASQNVAMSPDADNPRINRVILRLDTDAKIVDCVLLEGTAAAVPVAPTLTYTGTVFELSLCQVYVAAAAGTIAQSNITDERPWAGPHAPLVAWLTNSAAADRVYGDLVVVDSDGDKAFKTTTAARDLGVLGVVGEDDGIVIGASGRIICSGLARVHVDAATTHGQYLVSSTTAGKCTPKTNRELGTFAVALETTTGDGLAWALLLGGADNATITPTAQCPVAYDADANVPAGTVDTDAIEAAAVVAAKMTAKGCGAFVWHIPGLLATSSNIQLEYVAPWAITLTGGYIIANVAPTGAAVILDVHTGAGAGTTVFTTQGNRPTLADGATGPTAVVAPDVTAVAAGTRVFCAVDQIGSTLPGQFVTLVLAYKYALVD
jgi:hypothetical protein